MAYITGTATDYKDLLADLKTEATTNAALVAANEEWTAERYTTGSEYELILKGQGLSQSDEIYVGIKTYSDVAGDYYNWQLQGFSGYESGSDFEDQPGAIVNTGNQRAPILPLWDGSIQYWMAINGRRIILVAKVSTVYMHMYLGFSHDYGLPNQLPYPLVIGGSSTAIEGERWSVQHNDVSAYWNPGISRGNDINYDNDYKNRSALRIKHGDWLGFANLYNTSSVITANGQDRIVWPLTYQWWTSDLQHANCWLLMGDDLDGDKFILPFVILSYEDERNNYGQFDGVYWVSGYGGGAEDTITIGGDTYIVFPNVFRSQTFNFCAIKQE